MSEGHSNPSNEIDLIQYGRLLQAVENLTVEIEKLRRDELAPLRADMENMKRGKYVLYGAMVAAGAIGASAAMVFGSIGEGVMKVFNALASALYK